MGGLLGLLEDVLDRFVPEGVCSCPVAEVLAAHLAQWAPHPALGVVFTNELGHPIQERTYRGVWATARARAGAPEWATPHDLRHFYASVLIRSGASVKVVQARLGHASAKTTLDTHAHIWPDEEDRTRAAIDAEFGGACHPGCHGGGR